MHCRVRYLLDFDLKISSGQVCLFVCLKSNNLQNNTLGRLVIHPSDPANQRIILKIVGFQNTLSGRSLNRIKKHIHTSQMFIQFFQRMNHHKLFDIDSQKSVNYRGCGIVKDNWLISSSKISNHCFKPICCREISRRNVTTI